MTLNKSNGDMYKWITHTWNPLAGTCSHDCVYCYVKKMLSKPVLADKYSGKPRIHPSEMKTNLGKNNFIFVCNMSDLFAEGVQEKDIHTIMNYLIKFQNQYLIQTKNPTKAIPFIMQYENPKWFKQTTSKFILATTIETDRYRQDNISSAPSIKERINALKKYSGIKTITIEPILKFNLDNLVRIIKSTNPKWVSIGADSFKNNLEEPKSQEIYQLIKSLSQFTKIIKKKNLKRLTD